MHILIIPSWYKSITEPVLGTFFEEQARALQHAGHTVGIIYPQFTPAGSILKKKDKVVKFYNDNGIPTYSIIFQALIPKIRKLSYKMFNEQVERLFKKYCSQFGNPDIIHAHSIFHGGIAGYYIAQNNQIPFVITEHLTSFMTGGISHEEDLQLSRDIFNNADASVIVSHHFKNDLQKSLALPDSTFTVIHNLVADLFFENRIEKKYFPDEEFTFFTNSFLLPRKNHKLILEALHHLKIHHGFTNFKLNIGGDGPLRDELINYTHQLGLEQKVCFLGALSRQDVKKHLDDCHAFVLASTYETFGVVLIESLACGRPVVTTDSGGPRDFINTQNGIFAESHSAAHLAEALLNMTKTYETFNQKAMSEYCHQHFSEKKIESEIEALYIKAIHHNRTFNKPRYSL
jgi:glycosyltransferase involved in cell wall biosynthesis